MITTPSPTDSRPPERRPYERIDRQRLEAGPPAGEGSAGLDAPGASPSGVTGRVRRLRVRWTIIPLSVLLCVAQAVVATLAENTAGVILTPTLISVIAMAGLFVLVLVANPLLRLALGDRLLRPLNRAELTCIFTALLVTSGISTFGLASQLVPLIGSPWYSEWNTPQRGWDEAVLPHLNPALYLSVPADGTPEQVEQAHARILAFREGVRPVDEAGQVILAPPADAPWSAQAAYWWQVAKLVPWGAWVRPLSLWLIFIGACYGLFYSLTYVVLPFWARREKLIFPLAKLPESLLPEEGSRRWWPPIFSSLGFWAAFALAAGASSWNAAVAAEWITGLGRINLGMSTLTVRDIVQGTIFEGLHGGAFSLMFLIIFTAIGLAFLLPLEISFSIWFYFLVAKAMVLLAIWAGYGQTGDDFPTDWLTTNNFITAQGAGGILLFSAISLARCLADLRRLARGRSRRDRFMISLPVMGLALSLAVIVAWCAWNRIPVLAAIALALFLTLITVGLMRLVAEGGIFWFQAHVSPFHLFSVFGLGKVVSVAFMAPFMLIYSVLFLDIKTFLAPNLLNAAKMQEDVRADRVRFHLNLVLCVVVSVVVALLFAVFLAHLRGAQQMHGWFYSGAPTYVLDSARRLVTEPAEFQAGTATWYGLGGVWVALSMVVRRVLFWFPHPIGYVMFINPLMAQLWFSFFLGWVCKKVVVKYGGKTTFDRIMPIFVGLIIGELIAIFAWTVMGLTMDFQPGITLNRYAP